MQARQIVDKWLFRLGAAEPGEVVLNQRRVFILPSKAGLGFGALLMVLFVSSINYNLSLGFALTFLIAACAVIDMHLTFRNLAYLHLSPGRVQPVFAGEDARFEMHLANRRGHDRYAIWIGFIGDGSASDRRRAAANRALRPLANLNAQALDIGAMSSCSVILSSATVRRGWLAAPRVRLTTRFPLGLLHAWSYWYPELSVLVYPRPETDAPPLPLMGEAKTDGIGRSGSEDFAGIRAYRPGDSIKHLAWRQIARVEFEAGGQLVTKHFEGGAASDLMLDYDQLPRNLSIEARLSRLTRWVLEAEERGLAYGFRLGSVALEPALGPAQQQACLRALALYQRP